MFTADYEDNNDADDLTIQELTYKGKFPRHAVRTTVDNKHTYLYKNYDLMVEKQGKDTIMFKKRDLTYKISYTAGKISQEEAYNFITQLNKSYTKKTNRRCRTISRTIGE